MTEYEFQLISIDAGQGTANLITRVGAWSILGTIMSVFLKGSLLANHSWYYCLLPIGAGLLGSVCWILIVCTYLNILEKRIGE